VSAPLNLKWTSVSQSFLSFASEAWFARRPRCGLLLSTVAERSFPCPLKQFEAWFSFFCFRIWVWPTAKMWKIIKYYCGTLVFVPAKMEMYFKGFSFFCLRSFLSSTAKLWQIRHRKKKKGKQKSKLEKSEKRKPQKINKKLKNKK
jgi:hypothetical protein